MGATTHQDIQSAFDTLLNTLTVVGFSNSQIQWQNVDFAPDPVQAWLRVKMIWGPTTQGEIGSAGHNLKKGIYQVEVSVPSKGGWALGLLISDSIVQLFKRGTALSSGSVSILNIQSSTAGPPTTIDAWWKIPVSVRWWAYTDN